MTSIAEPREPQPGEPQPDDPPPSPWRWVLYAIGAAMIFFGLVGQVTGPDTKPLRWLVLLVVAALAHDVVLAPLLLLLALVVRRTVPTAARGAVQGGALVVLCLAMLGAFAAAGRGARGDNSSLLPRHYGAGLVLSVALVALGTVGTALWHARRARRL